MKFLKGFATFIIGVLLFVLMFALSLILRLETFVEKELVVSAVKEVSIQEIKGDDATNEQKKLIEKMLEDEKSEEIIQKIVQNYISYKEDSNYEVSKDDYDLLIDYIVKHLDEINAVSDTKLTEAEVREQFKYEDFKKNTKEVFEDFDKDSKDMSKTMNLYTKVTSNNTKLILIVSIVICILLITLVNWAFIKWLKVVGINLIIIGVIFAILYGFGLFMQSKIMADENVLQVIRAIDIKGFLITAIVEVVVGIVLLVVYKLLNKKETSDEETTQMK